MKRFRFPFRAVEVLRADRERRARETFGAAVQACVKSEHELAVAQHRVAQFEAAVSAGRSGRFSATAESHALAAYKRECTMEGQAERSLAVARTGMNQSRVDYLEARRRLEVVHRLEAKARAEHRIASSREEQAEFDEFAGRKAALRIPIQS
jgi:flagellar export protein FliJ